MYKVTSVLKIHWPWIIWLILTFLLMGFPGDFFPKVPNIIDLFAPDKIVHFVIFGCLVYLLCNSFSKNYQGTNLKRMFFMCLVVGIIIGGITEVMQHYVFIGRNGNYVDFIADLIGAFMGWSIYLIQNRKKYAKKIM